MGLFDRLFGKKEVSPSGSPIMRYKGDGTRHVGLPSAPVNWMEIRDEFCQQHFGKITHVYHEKVPQDPHIDIFPCEPDPSKGRNYYTFVTSGMSDLPMHAPKQVPREQRRAELIMYASAEDVEGWKAIGLAYPHEFMRMIASIAHGYKTWFGPFHTMPIGNPPAPIVPGSCLTSIMFVVPDHEPPYVRNGLKLGNEPVSFLWVVPISDAECNLKLEKGGEALWSLMKANNHPIAMDMLRQSYL